MATPPDAPAAPGPGGRAFEVRLDNFEGPFDLLLTLISKHRLDITEVSLAAVTDDFIAYIRAAEADAAQGRGSGWDLSTASEFLVVAATLLDLKAARLLPQGEVDDAEDLELLEARDLLFARLLQYRAYKQVAGVLAERFATEGRRYPRVVSLEPALASLLPDLVWTVGPDELARIAARALGPRPEPPGVSLAHLHAPAVSVREQAAIVAERVRREGTVGFRALAADAGSTLVVVARFLALLELFREGLVGFEQVVPLGDLTVRWAADDTVPEVSIETDYDDDLRVEATGYEGDEPRPAAHEEAHA